MYEGRRVERRVCRDGERGESDADGGELIALVLIFGLAGTVDHAEFRKQFREKRAISIGFFGQFVLLPFFGFCAVKAFNLTALGKPTAEEMAALASGREDPANATATPPITYADFNVGIEAVILLLTLPRRELQQLVVLHLQRRSL